MANVKNATEIKNYCVTVSLRRKISEYPQQIDYHLNNKSLHYTKAYRFAIFILNYWFIIISL